MKSVLEFRADVRKLIEEFVPEGWQGIGTVPREDRDAFIARWRKVVSSRGLLAPTWPIEYGGAALTVEEEAALFEELSKGGLPLWSDTDAVGVSLVGNATLQWGSPKVKEKFLPRILAGEDVWCQGFSEPESGSDLASVATKARLIDGRWVINGQKIWSSGAAAANWIFMLARTEPEAPTHRGISMLLVPMDQPGIEVRPIKNIRGDDEFCEVFFTDAVTEADMILGERGDGWKVTMSILGYERGETVLYIPVEYAEELSRMDLLAHETGAIEEPSIRRRLAYCHMVVAQMKAVGARELARLAGGAHPGPEAGAFKVLYSEYHQYATQLAMDMLGQDALAMTGHPSVNWLRADDPGSPNSARAWLEVFLNSRAESIYAGTNQIQRNIIGEMILGLPREPRVV